MTKLVNTTKKRNGGKMNKEENMKTHTDVQIKMDGNNEQQRKK
jgi:hypothetical protein